MGPHPRAHLQHQHRACQRFLTKRFRDLGEIVTLYFIFANSVSPTGWWGNLHTSLYFPNIPMCMHVDAFLFTYLWTVAVLIIARAHEA